MSIVKSNGNDFLDTGFSVKSLAKKKNSHQQPSAMNTTWTALNTTATPTTRQITDTTRFGIYPQKLDEARSQSTAPHNPLIQTINYSNQITALQN
jgi:hypothetical protein